MAIPSDPTPFSWATDTNYTGGPEAGQPTKVAPSAGRQAEGVEPGAKFPAQEFNAILNSIGANLTQRTICVPPFPNVDLGGDFDESGTSVLSTSAGSVIIAVPVQVGDRLRGLRYGLAGNSSADVTGVALCIVGAAGGGAIREMPWTSADAVSNPGAYALQTLEIDLDDGDFDAEDFVVALGECVQVTIAVNAADIEIGPICLTVDRPVL